MNVTMRGCGTKSSDHSRTTARRGGRIAPLLVAMLILAVTAVAGGALAQTLPGSLNGVPPEVRDQLRRDLAGAGRSGGERVLDRPTFRPGQSPAGTATAEPVEQPLSPLERDYSQRADTVLRQFGYETLQPGAEAGVVGALPADYRLGVGDSVIVALRGAENRTETLVVERDGSLLLPDLPPIPAAGRRLGEVESDVARAIGERIPGTEAYLTLGDSQGVTVFVSGEVGRPGLRNLPGMASILDALVAAGGVKKTGSLRAVTIVRGDGGDTMRTTVDLYDLLLGRGGRDVALRDGDRVLVPGIGPTFAVAGAVNRPGIFELPAGGRSVTLEQALDMAAGAVRPRGSRVFRLTLQADGTSRVDQMTSGASVASGDVITVGGGVSAAADDIEVVGNAPPTVVSLESAPSLRALLSMPGLLKRDTYRLFAVLQRIDPRTRARVPMVVSPRAALEGFGDVYLQSGDRVILLAQDDVLFLNSGVVQATLQDRAVPQGTTCRGLDQLAYVLATSTPTRFAHAQTPLTAGAGGADVYSREWSQPAAMAPWEAPAQPWETPQRRQVQPSTLQAPQPSVDAVTGSGSGPGAGPAGRRGAASTAGTSASRGSMSGPTTADATAPAAPMVTCPDTLERYPGVLPMALEHAVFVTGAVAQPGLYPLAGPEALEAVLQNAGGLAREADLGHLEVSTTSATGDVTWDVLDLRSRNFAAVTLQPGGFVKIPLVPTTREPGFVTVEGEVVRPGHFALTEGTTLLDVLERAGGLTDEAYPVGAVFLRRSVAQKQREGLDRSARELEHSLIVMARQAGSDNGDAAPVVQAGQSLVEALRRAPAPGRMAVEADPTVLRARPELNVLLEPGDKIVIPPRPSDVAVIGAVLNPGSFQFVSGTSVSRYLEWAGGMQDSADDGRVFVVYPNGRAEPVSLSSWNLSSVTPPPGSSIVVPIDPSPFEGWRFTRDMADILSKVALSAASLAVINR